MHPRSRTLSYARLSGRRTLPAGATFLGYTLVLALEPFTAPTKLAPPIYSLISRSLGRHHFIPTDVTSQMLGVHPA